jgi:hypothetical protein
VILDQLLREKRFVDLYRVVQAGLYASEPGYSIKDLEAFYMPKRSGEVSTAGASVVAYDNWRNSREEKIFHAIHDYNKTDCESTELLRDWLVANVRPKDLPWFDPAADRNEEGVKPATSRMQQAEEARREWQQKVKAAEPVLGEATANLIFSLAFFHEREDKPVYWTMFDRAERPTEELIDDLECLGGLTASGKPEPMAKSFVRTYAFPPQETKLRAGAQLKRRDTMKTVTLVDISGDDGVAKVKFGPSAGPPPNTLDLIPSGPLDNDALVAGLHTVLNGLIVGKHGAAHDLLHRRRPRISPPRKGPLVSESDIVAEAVDVISALDSSVLPIQGPPGTGKTYLSSKAILTLLKQGKRVAVSSNSHEAINNLMQEIMKRADEQGFTFTSARKIGKSEEDAQYLGITVVGDYKDPALASSQLVGGTAWLFARDEHDAMFDYLFIDEAGQVSLANALAMARCARNLVLVGDPMQLPQVIQGTHPHDAGLSCLAHLLKGHVTVPSERGIFLPESQRMHRAVCRYVSELFYESRLASAPETSTQSLLLVHRLGLPPAGIRFIGVDHESERQSSSDEAQAVGKLVAHLLQSRFRDKNGRERAIGLEDILVIAPYNAQVNLLLDTLPRGARVGTVDKFQGQEAPVCILSMASSSAEDVPRGIEFLFSLNRLNVAVSRAQALAIVVGCPKLMSTPCSSREQMRIVNAFCATALQ